MTHRWTLSQRLIVLTLAGLLLAGQSLAWSAAFASPASDGDWSQQLPAIHPSPRYNQGMAAIGEGYALLFGANTLNDAETWLYDGAAAAWTQLFPVTQPPAAIYPALAPIGGDQALLFGRIDSDTSQTWLYDRSDNTWTQLFPATSPSARYYHSLAHLGGDQVLLFGGQDAQGTDGETWIYDLSDNAWTPQGPVAPPAPRWGHAMAHLGGDQVLLFGGEPTSGSGDQTWIYDLSDETWTPQDPASHPSTRVYHTLTAIGNGQALLFGGMAAGYDDETWLYDASANTWTQISLPLAPSARAAHAAASLGGDQALLFGGASDGGAIYADTWCYDLNVGTWTQQGPLARHYHALATIDGDKALLFGGFKVGVSFDDETWVYGPGDGSWTQSPAAGPTARAYHALASLSGDQALLFGGQDSGGLDGETWLYDLGDDTWTQQSPPAGPSARKHHALAHLGGDQVLLFGGWDGGGLNGETWVYDLGADTWTQQSPAASPSARAYHALVPIGGDQALLYGGQDSVDLNSETWLYDLGDDAWTELSPAASPFARAYHALASLGGDRVLLFGGFDAIHGLDNTTWIFDLGDNAWTQVNPAVSPAARRAHALAALGGGQVLLFGGKDGNDSFGETWLFQAQSAIIPPTSSFVLYSRADDTIWLKDEAGHAQLMDGARPRLSPGGRYLAYQDEAIWGDLYVRDLETGQVTKVYTSSGTLLLASWTPDGNRLVFDHGCRIHAVDRDGSNLEALIDDWPAYYDCYNDSPDVNPVDGRIAWENEYYGLGVAQADGSNPAWVPNTQPYDYSPRWSPAPLAGGTGGQWLAFWRDNNAYKIRPDGSGLTQLTFLSGDDWLEDTGQWTPDGTHLVAAAQVGGTEGLYAVPTDGSGQLALLIAREWEEPDWVGSVGDVQVLLPQKWTVYLPLAQKSTP